MNRIIFAALILFAVPARAAEYRAGLIYNYDGDTLTMQMPYGVERVRVSNIDTPEIKGECRDANDKIDWTATLAARKLATDARDFATAWLDRIVTLHVDDKRPRDRYRRLLARVVNDEGEDFGEAIIAAGYARPWTGKRRPWCEAQP